MNAGGLHHIVTSIQIPHYARSLGQQWKENNFLWTGPDHQQNRTQEGRPYVPAGRGNKKKTNKDTDKHKRLVLDTCWEE